MLDWKIKKKLKIKLEKINEVNNKKVIYFEKYKNIDSVSGFFNETIYFDGKNDLFESELVNYDLVFKNKKLGKVEYIFDQKKYSSICFEYNKKKTNIPLIDNFILSINEVNKVIYLRNVEFLFEDEKK